MPNVLWLITLLFTLSVSSIASAQSTRSLSGTLTLDVGPSEIARDIEITVNNHSFVVIPPAFTILRPITSRESTIVRMQSGTSQVNYSIENIVTDPVDYSIAIRCLGCANNIPTQFYTPSGNAFGLVNSAFIDPEDLPTTLDFTAITRASIKGEIVLNKTSERDLRFRVTVLSDQNIDRTFGTPSLVILALGENSISYSITGLPREIGSDQYRVKLECTNCLGQSRRAQFFANTLSPNQNHSEIDFLATDISVPVLAPILLILLE